MGLFDRGLNVNTVVGLTESGRAIAVDDIGQNAILGRLEEQNKTIGQLSNEMQADPETIKREVSQLIKNGYVKPAGGF
jgi:hypothetical protein